MTTKKSIILILGVIILMATLPSDRTKLALAQANQVPSAVASAQRNIDTLTEAYDTIDLLNQKVDTHANAATLPHADGSVTTAKLAKNAVTNDKIASKTITSDKFVAGALTNETENGLRITALETESTNNISSRFLNRLVTGQVTKIKLIGDSITDGNGARNYTPPPESNPIIFDDGAGNVFHEPAYTNTSWANMFRNFIVSDFPSVEFVNAGIGGKSAKWANANKQYWVDENEDVVFVMLGTNDRWDTANPAEFKTNLESFLSYVDARSNVMVVLTANPTFSDADTETYNFGMKEVDRIITEICQRNGYIHISLYREMLRYSERSGATLKTLIEDNGSHPIDEGYAAMWHIIQQRLGLIDDTDNWSHSNPSAFYTVLIGNQYPYVMSTTPITFFETGKSTVVELGADSDIENFPAATTGLLTTYRGFSNDLSSRQLWEPRENYDIYKRTWNFGTSSWRAWKKLNADDPFIDKTTVTITPGSIGAGAIVEMEVLVPTINSSYTMMITVKGAPESGVMFSPYVNYTANRVYLRVHNTTASPITVSALDVICVQYDYS